MPASDTPDKPASMPPLYGLVLAGGKSQRMGTDKGLLRWHGTAQRYYLADLLQNYCGNVFISCRDDQAAAIRATGYQPLPDNSPAKGQYGAILTATAAYPDAAWLVVACDLPLFDAAAAEYLIRQRNPALLATAYADTAGGLPEPLAAIWEPSSRAMLLAQFAGGITCPRKALILSGPDVRLVTPPDPRVIINTNTPEDARLARQIIRSQAASHAD